MTARKAADLLDKARVHILEQAALGFTAVGLFGVTCAIEPPTIIGLIHPQSKYTWKRRDFGGAPSRRRSSTFGHRGHAQHCLSLLAKEGIMFERLRPEPGRFSGERCDKYFRIRIKKDEAIAKLRAMGRKIPVKEEGWSAHWSPTLGFPPALRYID